MPPTLAPFPTPPQPSLAGIPASREFTLLLAASSFEISAERSVRIRDLLAQQIDWRKFTALVEHHGMIPLLYRNLAAHSAAIPPDAFQALSAKFESNTRQALWLTNLLARVLDTLPSRGIQALPFKGPILSKTLYNDISLRQFSDLDILVRPVDVPRAKFALGEIGFKPNLHLSQPAELAYLASGYEYSFDGFGQKNVLELQWRVLPRFYSVDFEVASFLERASVIQFEQRLVHTLSTEDLLLVLCAHAAKHRWGRLSWICDIADLAISNRIHWEQVKRDANRLGINRIVGISFFLAQSLLGTAIPRAFETLTSDEEVQHLGSQILSEVVESAECDTEAIGYFRLMASLRERTSDKIRFFTRLAFTPGLSEWSVVQLPAPLFPLYRVIRLFRLLRKLI
jgi:hypothetical protein